MTALRSLLQDYHKLDTPQTILLGDNSSYKATGFGFALLRLSNGKGLLIKDILFVPGLAKNLISVAQLTSIGNTIVIFKSDQCIITTESPTSKEPMKLYIPKFENLLSLGIGIEISSSGYSATTFSKSDLTTMKWHHKLGHLNIRYLNTMNTQELVIGLPPIKSTLSTCEGCILGNITRYPIRPNLLFVQ
jgi:hypothetical protein